MVHSPPLRILPIGRQACLWQGVAESRGGYFQNKKVKLHKRSITVCSSAIVNEVPEMRFSERSDRKKEHGGTIMNGAKQSPSNRLDFYLLFYQEKSRKTISELQEEITLLFDSNN